jgi:glycosyltransferase involved in cell wall biosynthesis
MHRMKECRVTILYVQRERFSPSTRTLPALYESTDVPFELVVVDAGSGPRMAAWLRSEAAARGFKLIRREQLLTPDAARNLAAEGVATEFTCVLDNDVLVDRGWLETLLQCADETGAEAVAPLTCEGEPLGERVHFAGGDVEVEHDGAARRIKDRMFHSQRRMESVRDSLERMPVRLAEFHALLIKTAVRERVGEFDEDLITRDHLDYCLRLADVGATIMFEPAAIVHYLPDPPADRHDLYFFMVRWSDAWERRSLERFRAKWGLEDDAEFQRRLAGVGWRRRKWILEPLFLRRPVPRKLGGAALKAAARPEHAVNRLITARHDRMAERTAA